MTKQKMVVKLLLGDTKKRKKALKTAVIMDGVVSAALDGDKLVVIGDGTDSVTMTTLLRKKLGYADLISVASAEEKKEEKKVHPLIHPYQYTYSYPYTYQDSFYGHHKF
ncbi:heavy metal-associated isoprenylated plant protein 47-like isoform X2 [Carex rostrata]